MKKKKNTNEMEFIAIYFAQIQQRSRTTNKNENHN